MFMLDVLTNPFKQQNLPTDSTLATLKTHFEQFGKVSYISVPKFKSTSGLKGFAFVEFEDKSSAKRALEVFIHSSLLLYNPITRLNIQVLRELAWSKFSL